MEHLVYAKSKRRLGLRFSLKQTARAHLHRHAQGERAELSCVIDQTLTWQRLSVCVCRILARRVEHLSDCVCVTAFVHLNRIVCNIKVSEPSLNDDIFR